MIKLASRLAFPVCVLVLAASPAFAEEPAQPAPAPVAPPAPVAAPVAAPAPVAALPTVAPAPANPALDPKNWPKFIPLADAQGRDLSSFGYQQVRKKNRRMIIAGASVFGGAYLLSGLLGSAGTDLEGSGDGAWMFVPVVGPVAWAATSGGSGTTNYLLGLDSAAQATGIALFALGFHGKPGWERKPAFLLVPTASAAGVGARASGTF